MKKKKKGVKLGKLVRMEFEAFFLIQNFYFLIGYDRGCQGKEGEVLTRGS